MRLHRPAAATAAIADRVEASEHRVLEKGVVHVPALVLRLKDDYDGAEPSGNSIAILNLLRVARMTGRKAFEEIASNALAAFAGRMAAVPDSMPQMLAALEYSRSKPAQIVLVGTRRAAEPFLCQLRRRFLPAMVVLLSDSEESRLSLARYAPESPQWSPPAPPLPRMSARTLPAASPPQTPTSSPDGSTPAGGACSRRSPDSGARAQRR